MTATEDAQATTSRARTLRPVGLPVPVAVQTDAEQRPVALTWRGERQRVAAVLDAWRLDDEWWRTPIRRLYYRVVLTDRVVTVFVDLCTGRWYTQNYRFRPGLPARPTDVPQRQARPRSRPHTALRQRGR